MGHSSRSSLCSALLRLTKAALFAQIVSCVHNHNETFLSISLNWKYPLFQIFKKWISQSAKWNVWFDYRKNIPGNTSCQWRNMETAQRSADIQHYSLSMHANLSINDWDYGPPRLNCTAVWMIFNYTARKLAPHVPTSPPSDSSQAPTPTWSHSTICNT